MTHAPTDETPAEETLTKLLEQLHTTVARVIDFYRTLEIANVPDAAGFSVGAVWTARDALVHIVFWHESFARNVDDLADGRAPTPLKGTYAQLSARAAEENRDVTTAELLGRLESAQRTIEQSVLSPQVRLIPYKVGSRSYLAPEHLRVVNEHVSGHFRKVETGWANRPRHTP